MKPTPRDVRWLVDQLDDQKRRLQNLENRKPGLAYSSIEDGAIREYDKDGTLGSQTGKQPDGTHGNVVYNGPKPPTPSLPTATAIPGIIEVRWNGKFANDAVSPLDFKHVAAYVVPVGAPVDFAAQAGVMTGELGDGLQVQTAPGVHDIYLVSWTLAGEHSGLAGPVSVVSVGAVDGMTLGGKMTVATRAPTLGDGEGKPVDALWNQIDPATDEQVAVWRWTGGAWVDFPISETMLPLVNIAEGTYGRLQGVQLEADAIDGLVITGAIIQSPGSGAGYQLTESGYTSRDEAGNVTVRLPADGSPAQFKGDIEAESLTASGRVSMQAPSNEIASGASVVLEAGVTPPLTPPTIGAAYASIPLPALASSETASGLAFADGLWWRAVDAAGTDTGDKLEAFNSAGATVRSYPIGVGTKLNGIAAIGTEIFILGVKHGQPANTRHVLVYGVDGTFKREWAYTNYGTGTFQPGIGTDGTNIIIGQCWADGLLTWRIYNKTTGAITSTINTAYRRYDSIAGLVQTTGDFGSTRVVVAFTGGATESFTTAGTHTGASESYYSAGKTANRGITWQGGSFWQYSDQSGIVQHSSIKDPTGVGAGDTDDWWVAATWRGPSGVETTAGPPRRFVFMRRSELQLSAGTLPAGATGARFYLARKSTVPTRTDMHLLATTTGPSARVNTLPSNWVTLANPPLTNTFSAAGPGLIRSRADNFQVDGAGAGKWGPLVFHADGTMTSNAVPDWVPITSFEAGCAVGDFGFVPAYRSWPDGKVELRGVIKGTLDVSKPICTLPSPMKPAEPINVVAATNASAGNPGTMRVEFGSVSNPTKITIYPQGQTRTWMSLDGLYYYLV